MKSTYVGRGEMAHMIAAFESNFTGGDLMKNLDTPQQLATSSLTTVLMRILIMSFTHTKDIFTRFGGPTVPASRRMEILPMPTGYL